MDDFITAHKFFSVNKKDNNAVVQRFLAVGVPNDKKHEIDFSEWSEYENSNSLSRLKYREQQVDSIRDEMKLVQELGKNSFKDSLSDANFIRVNDKNEPQMQSFLRDMLSAWEHVSIKNSQR